MSAQVWISEYGVCCFIEAGQWDFYFQEAFLWESPSAYTGLPFDDLADLSRARVVSQFVQHGSTFSLVLTVGLLRLVLVSVSGVQCFVHM